MIRVTTTRSGRKRYMPRVHTGGGKYDTLGTYPTREKAREVEAQWLLARKGQKRSGQEFADFWLEGYEQRVKASTAGTARSAIRHWLRSFGNRSLHTIDALEAETWARSNRWAVPAVVTMLNDAVEKGVLEANPFRGLGRKGPGRRDTDPLTVNDVDRLAAVARRLHGDALAAFLLFTAYTGMRVGEVFALQWPDIDFERNRVMVRRRLYGSELDLPKSNRVREIVLVPPARDALLSLDRSTDWVFLSKTGKRMSQSILGYYWRGIEAAFGRRVTPHELKHFAGHHLYVTMGLPDRVVAVQLGHRDGGKLVRELYGHGDVGALEEIDRAYENVVPLRKASGE